MKLPLPLFKHDLQAPSAFTPELLIAAVRATKHLEIEPIPPVCVLEFDGDLTDWLVSTGAVKPWKSWACFHTTMYLLEVDGVACGIVPRTIGGPFAVLVAEQMAASGAQVVLGLTSAGRVSSTMPVPGLVDVVGASPKVVRLLEEEFQGHSLPVLSGTVWTVDAPYRETVNQLTEYANAKVLAVEMQAASLFAFSEARQFPVGVVGHVTNSMDQASERFDKGTQMLEFEILKRICRAGIRYV